MDSSPSSTDHQSSSSRPRLFGCPSAAGAVFDAVAPFPLEVLVRFSGDRPRAGKQHANTEAQDDLRKTFLAAHWDALAAADFFTVEVLTLGGLVRYVVFFVMKLKTRAVEIAGITSQPDEVWMTQLARNLTDASDGVLHEVQYIILDRDPLYSAAFRRLLRDSGVKPLLLPARSPNLNAFAERFVSSVKSECLDRIVPLGEAHLRAAVSAFVHHYHVERPHQGLSNDLIAAKSKSTETGPVRCHEHLGGILKFYYREAA